MDSAALPTAVQKPTRVRFGVLLFACSLSMITYVDRVCFGTMYGEIKSDFAMSDRQMGWLLFAFAFAYAVFEIPGGCNPCHLCAMQRDRRRDRRPQSY